MDNSTKTENLPITRVDPTTSLGAILTSGGRLTPEQVAMITAHQKSTGLAFGQAALALRLISSEDLSLALSKQHHYSYLPASDTSLSQDVVAAYRPFSPVCERFRALRTQLYLRCFDDVTNPRPLVITSQSAGEGKSFVAANLAVTFAQQGVKTLLIDANLRLPYIHHLFKQSNRAGLAAVLADRAQPSDVICSIPGIKDLHILPAGNAPPNPQELLTKPRFGELLRRATMSYSVVIIDTPAIADFADAGIVAARAGTAAVVIRKNFNKIEKTKNAITSLNELGVNIVGCIANEY